MYNKNKMLAAMALKGMTIKELANKMNLNVATVSRKLNGKTEFNRKEIQMVCDILDVESPIEIFFEK